MRIVLFFFINNDAKLLYLDTQTAKLTAKERECIRVIYWATKGRNGWRFERTVCIISVTVSAILCEEQLTTHY